LKYKELGLTKIYLFHYKTKQWAKNEHTWIKMKYIGIRSPDIIFEPKNIHALHTTIKEFYNLKNLVN